MLYPQALAVERRLIENAKTSFPNSASGTYVIINTTINSVVKHFLDRRMTFRKDKEIG
jgi:hypothetical protein